MAKGTVRKTAAKSVDYDTGIREQLEPYGSELDDIVAILEEDPALMQYVIQGDKGESLARAADRSRESTGYCATGVKKNYPIIICNSNCRR